MKHFLISVFAFLVVYSSGNAKADAIYSKMQDLYARGAIPKLRTLRTTKPWPANVWTPIAPWRLRPVRFSFTAKRTRL